MSITAYKVEAVGHDRTGKDFGYVNIMYRYGNKKSCPRPDQCEKMEVMWADESVYGPPAPGSKVGDSGIPAMPGGCTTSTGRLRGRIGTVLRYAPRQTHHRLPIIWPVTRNIFTKTMR